MRLFFVLAAVATAECHAYSAPASAQNLDGITIVQLSDSDAETVRNVITGSSTGSGSHIVAFISAQGSYAALQDRQRRLCVAWAEPGSYTGSSIAFGLPPTEQSLKLVNPPICQPFTLSLASPSEIGIEAANKHGPDGPLAPIAREITYSGKQAILARVPLITFDWGMPLFSKYDIKGVSLGPVPALKEHLAAAKVDMYRVQRASEARRQRLRVTTSDPSDPTASIEVRGLVATAEVMGWPWDVIYSAEYRQYVREPTLGEKFELAIVERYGSPSRSGPGAEGRHLHWFFNLAGQQLTYRATAPENCLSTREHWINEVDLGSFEGDIGPWGCALIMLATHNGRQGVVSQYGLHVTSGYALALKHFAHRLEEIAATQRKIEGAQTFKPKL